MAEVEHVEEATGQRVAKKLTGRKRKRKTGETKKETELPPLINLDVESGSQNKKVKQT